MTGRDRGCARKAPIVLGLVLGLAFAGCSGGEDEPSVPCLSASFTPAIGAIVPGDVFLGEMTSTCTSVEVSVIVSDLSGIFTVGFDLSYPASVVRYDSYATGPLLFKNSPTNSPFFLVTNSGSGLLQVSATRLSPDAGVAAVGNEILMTLKFSKVASGTGAIDFNDGAGSQIAEVVLDENGTTRPASFQADHGGIVLAP